MLGRLSLCFSRLSTQTRSRKKAVTQTWEKNLATLEDGTSISDEIRVQFVGWDQCSKGYDDGIRIRIADERPSAKIGILNNGDGSTMVLNFEFQNWSPACQTHRSDCIRSLAVHEFGHALGFVHEQAREDAADDCESESWESNGDFYGDAWDLDSVMNYCNPDWNNHGRLSPRDQRWSRVVYYPEYYPEVSCLPIVEAKSQVDHEED